MSLDASAVEHICNVVRRQIQEEFPDLTLYFIVFPPEKKAKALDMKRREIVDHPAGALLLPVIEKTLRNGNESIQFSGLASAREKKLLPFTGRIKSMACFLVPGHPFKNEDEVRHQAYVMAWKALNLYLDQSNAKSPEPRLFPAPAADELTVAWQDMLGEAFSALLMELQGKRGYIRSLARERCAAALQMNSSFRPEDHPFPAIMDATLLVYEDLRHQHSTRLFATALDMTREIGTTFDSSIVLQWRAFSKPAQEMAWLHVDQAKILSAALHTSEDPYARSMAYLVMEVLNVEAGAFSDYKIYNAFADPEASQRHHERLCDNAFENVLSKAMQASRAFEFQEEADRQNKNLLAGCLTGWCVPALMAAAAAFENEGPDAARAAFQQVAQTITIETLQRLVQILIHERRQGHVPDGVTIQRIIAEI